MKFSEEALVDGILGLHQRGPIHFPVGGKCPLGHLTLDPIAGCPKVPILSKWVSVLAGPAWAQLLGHLLWVRIQPPHPGLAVPAARSHQPLSPRAPVWAREQWAKPSLARAGKRCHWQGPICLDMYVSLYSPRGSADECLGLCM